MSSENYSLSIVSFEPEPEYSFALQREIQKGETTKTRFTSNHLGARYTDVLIFDITVVKAGTICSQNEYFSSDESRAILRWLTSPLLPKELITFSEDNEPVYYYGLFTNAEPVVANGNQYGIKLQFTCTSQFGFTPRYSFSCDGGESITINNTSDEKEKSIYPIITINPSKTGIVIIENETIGKSISINCKEKDPVYIDCQNLIIKDKIGILKYRDIGWNLTDIHGVWWPELIYGENVFSVTGDATVIITCQFPKKVGDVN